MYNLKKIFVHFVTDFPLLRSCQVRILNHITWKKVAQFEHPATISNTKTVSSSIAVVRFPRHLQSLFYLLLMIPGGV